MPVLTTVACKLFHSYSHKTKIQNVTITILPQFYLLIYRCSEGKRQTRLKDQKHIESSAFLVLPHVYEYNHRTEMERPEGILRSYCSSPALKLDKYTYALNGVCLTCSSKPATIKMQQFLQVASSTIFIKYSYKKNQKNKPTNKKDKNQPNKTQNKNPNK